MRARAGSRSITLADAEATRRLGAAVAAACRPGTVVLLRGPLGAGKTTFADGFVAALGAGSATSPTFVLAHRYAGESFSVWHLDFYRLDAREIHDLDMNEYLAEDAITLVEWPERADFSWPADRIEIEFSISGQQRRADLRGSAGGVAAVDALPDAGD